MTKLPFPLNLHLKRPLAFFDLETTGTNPTHDRIVEISIIKVFPDGTHEIKTRRLNPTIPIPAEATMIHGISNEDVANEYTFKQVAKSLVDYLKGCDLAGFNILKFDLPLLVEEFLRAEVPFDPEEVNIVDAQRIFFMMEQRTLTAAFKFYVGQEISTLGTAHSAETDTMATVMVLNEQVKAYEGQDVFSTLGENRGKFVNDVDKLHALTNERLIDFAGRMRYNNNGVPVFNFGKYKDQPVADVLKREPNYYDWIMNGDFPLDTKNKLTRLKLGQSDIFRT